MSSYQHIGKTDQNGLQASGPQTTGVFSAKSIEFAFRPSSGDSSLQGFEIKIPFNEFNCSSSTRFQIFAVGVSSTAYFSDVTIPGNISDGNPGFDADFNNINGGPFHTNWQYINVASKMEPLFVRKEKNFLLLHNFPNPFNPTTTIRYDLPKACNVKLTIYNLLGQKVRTLVSKLQPAGQYRVQWDGRDERGNPAASGVYVYQLKVDNEYAQTRKMLLVR